MKIEFVPHEYQMYAINKIIEHYRFKMDGVGLFMEPGVGKTVCALTAIRILTDMGLAKKALVISTKRAATITWPDEIEKWQHLDGLTYALATGNPTSRLRALSSDANVYIINRENVDWLVKTIDKKGWPFDIIIVDESTSFKSHLSTRFKALARVAKLSRLVVDLTGTPNPNGLMDLWAQVFLLDQGKRLGRTITGYRELFFTPGYGQGYIVYKWEPKVQALEFITKRISDICISLKATDYLAMPELLSVSVPVVLPKQIMDDYRTLRRDSVLHVGDSDIVGGAEATLYNKLLQFANGAVYDEFGVAKLIHDEKIDALIELIESLNGEPVIVLYNYVHDMTRITNAIPNAVLLQTREHVDAWNRGELPVVIQHPASIGHGLNLQQGGRHIIWFGLTWNLEWYDQSNRRLYRQGQERPVIIHHLVAKGTIDETLIRVLASKDRDQQKVMEALKAEI